MPCTPLPPAIPQPLNPQTITLTTPRLLLRAGLPSDAPALHSIFSNPDVMRYWDTLPHTSLVQTTDWLAKMLASPQNGVTEFVMCLRTSASTPASASASPPHSKPTKSDGLSEAIGKIGIWRDTEIGFLLHHDYWRQGLMREAMEALLPYYFGAVEKGGIGLEVVTADTDPRNEATIGFLQVFGFEVTGREERTFQVGGEGGEWVDSLYLGLRREVWLERERTIGTTLVPDTMAGERSMLRPKVGNADEFGGTGGFKPRGLGSLKGLDMGMYSESMTQHGEWSFETG